MPSNLVAGLSQKNGSKRRRDKAELPDEIDDQRLSRAVAAVDDFLLRAAIETNPAAAPFFAARLSRIRGVIPD